MMAETNRRSTWSSHEHACTAFERGHVTGIGFVLFDTDICAFDIDNCRDPATGEIDPVAMSLVNRANSYTEVTVSGTGLRIIGTGSERYMNRKQKIDGSKVSIESYRNCERYITISGMVLDGTSPQLANIDALIDEVVVELTPQTETSETQDKKPETIDPMSGGACGVGLAYLEASLPPKLRDLVRDGVPDTEDRSAEFHHSIKWLKDCGWPIDNVIALLTQYPNGIARKYGLRLPAEAQRCFDKPDGAGANKTEIVQKKQNSAPGIPLTYYGEFGATADKVWILKGVIAWNETSSWIGPPGTGKSALITDISIHIASGEE
jgi:AAA domain